MVNYDFRSGVRGTLIFIHGAGGSRHKWRSLMADLPEGFGAMAIDLPGHGDSGGEALSSVPDYANALKECIIKANPPRPYVWVGHSLGGAIALTMAITQPDLVDYLVTVGSGARLRVAPEFLENLRQGIVNPVFKRRAFSPDTSEDLISIEIENDLKVSPAIVYKDFFACDHFDVLSDLPKISCPTLVIVGTDDLLTPVKYSEFLAQKVPTASMVIVPSAGHMIMLEQPTQVKQAIESFLQKNSCGGCC